MHEGNRVTAAAVLAIPSMLVEKHEMNSAHSIHTFAESEEVLDAGVRTANRQRVERLDLHITWRVVRDVASGAVLRAFRVVRRLAA